MLEKIMYTFSHDTLEKLTASKNNIRLSDDDILKLKSHRQSVDVKFVEYISCEPWCITIISSRIPTRHAIYMSVVEYIRSLLIIAKENNFQLPEGNEWFDPLIAAEQIESRLYSIIAFEERDNAVTVFVIKDYYDKINAIHIDLFGTRM